MKKLVVFIIGGYQLFLSPLLHQLLGVQTACRYSVSCSEYAKRAITKKGVIIGGYLAIKRIASCQPFSKQAQYGKYL
jgi:putative membrane protein insertion efficiency factor